MIRPIHIAQYTAFFGAQVFNSSLIHLIVTRSDKQFGDFRYIMGLFACYAMFYSWVEIFTQPLTFIEGPALGVIVDSPLRYEKWIGHYIVCLFFACFGLCISLLATQFFYRYLVLCKPQAIEKISGKRLPFSFIPSIFIFVFWYANVLVGMDNTFEKEQYLREAFQSDFFLDSYRVTFVVCMLWEFDEKNGKQWILVDCAAALVNVFIITSCFTFILICAQKMYKNSKEFKIFVSAKTRELNRQLFLCLVLQTLIPFILMYCPVGLLYVFPFFQIEVRWLVSIPALSCCIYPSIEPLIAISCIKGFRSIVFCQKAQMTGNSTTNTKEHVVPKAESSNNRIFVLVT